MSTPRFVNLQPGKVTVPSPDHRAVVVLPYFPGAQNALGATYILEGEHYAQFASAKGPLYPFPKSPEAVGAPGRLGSAPVGNLMHPNLAAAFQASGQSQAGPEAPAASSSGDGSKTDTGSSDAGAGTLLPVDPPGSETTPPPADNAEDDSASVMPPTSSDEPDEVDLYDDDEVYDDVEQADEDDADDAPPSDLDEDLCNVKNVGPQIRSALNMAGIHTFQALADAPRSLLVPLMRDGIIAQVQADAAVFADGGNPYAAKPSLRSRAR